MSAWGHRLVPLSDYQQGWGCNSCRGDYKTKPRAELAMQYDYITGRAGRVSTAERRLCRKHAESAAKRYGLQEQLAEWEGLQDG